MKHVTFRTNMSPFAVGDRRLVPDDVAAELEASGAIEPNPPDFPARAAQAAVSRDMQPRRSQRFGRTRDALLNQTYLTK